MAGGNWIKDLVDQKRERDAKARALALIAFGDANPTTAELQGFVPGQPIDPLRNVTGAAGTPGPEGMPDPALIDDLQAQLRNEELQRSATANAPAVQALRRSIALQEGGLNEVALGQAAAQRAQLPGLEATSADTVARTGVTTGALNDPNIDPLLKIDIADKKPVFKPQLVKVRRKDGTEVYMNQTPTLSGQPAYTPATDESGDPLGIPVKTASGRGSSPTALQKNAAFIARVLFTDDPEAEKKAVAMLTTLKGKAAPEAWDTLTREVAKMQYGRYAKDPQRLFEKTAEIWRVARPMEPLPTDAPAAPPSPAAAAAPSAGTAVRATKPAAAPTTGDAMLRDARAAIARGANPEAVKARLRSMGGNPDAL